MPSTTVQHEPWCQEHQHDADGDSCNAPPGGIQFGAMRPASRQFPAHPIGDAWAFQGEDDPAPRVTVDYGGTALDVQFADLRPLRDALDQLLAILEAGDADDVTSADRLDAMKTSA